MIESVQWWQAAASGVLVAIAVGLAAWLRLGVTRQILVAAMRAAVQLVVVGLVFGAIVTAAGAMWWAWLWVIVMVVVSAVVARRRAPELPSASLIAGAAIGLTVAICLSVIFALGVIAFEPVNLIVVAGITIGNTMPSMVLGAKRLTESFRVERGQIDAMLALGLSRRQVVQLAGAPIVKTALIPQIERTNVVGLIALPGAMTGLLLGGVDPLDAVLVQLVVMYLVLGAVATSVVVTVVAGVYDLFDGVTLRHLDG